MKLAQARSRALAAKRAMADLESRTDVMRDIRMEGYEDYSYDSRFNSAGYKGDELAAYTNGWYAAHEVAQTTV